MKVPDSVPLIGGTEVASASVTLHVTPDDRESYVTATGTLFGVLEITYTQYFDGRYDWNDPPVQVTPPDGYYSIEPAPGFNLGPYPYGNPLNLRLQAPDLNGKSALINPLSSEPTLRAPEVWHFVRQG